MHSLLSHEIVDDLYKIYQDGVCKLTIKLDSEVPGVIISTEKEVFSGPIDLICFTADIDSEIDRRK